MAQNYAQAYAAKVDERFKLKSLTDSVINKGIRLSWSGVKTVTVYDVDTVAESDYDRDGSTNTLSRYGTLANLGNGTTDYTLSQDKAFTFSIDKADLNDQQMVMEAGKALRRNLDEVSIPNTDIYRLKQFAITAGGALTGTGNGGTGQVVAAGTDTSATNAYETLLDAGVKLDEAKVPQDGRVAFVSPTFYKFLKLDDNFIKASDLGQKMLINGQVGEVDGVKIVKVPTNYLPKFAGATSGKYQQVDMVLVHDKVMVSPVKLADWRVHKDPQGVSGWVVESRRYYDAFVMSQKNKAIAIHFNAEA